MAISLILINISLIMEAGRQLRLPPKHQLNFIFPQTSLPSRLEFWRRMILVLLRLPTFLAPPLAFMLPILRLRLLPSVLIAQLKDLQRLSQLAKLLILTVRLQIIFLNERPNTVIG